MRGSIVEATSSRTTSPKRLRRSSSSTAWSRSSASSDTVKSASRVTRKKSWRRISIPGKSSSSWRAITRLQRHERAVADRHEARQHLLRHLHARERLDARTPGRARRRRSTATGSRCTGTAVPGPTASGVSTGKICSANSRSTSPRAPPRSSPRSPRRGCRAPRARAAPPPPTRATGAARAPRSAR